MGDTIEHLVGVLNGAVGDYLKRTANGLATPMTLVHGGQPIAPEGIAGAYPAPTPRVVVLVHGLMSTEVVWRMGAADYGALLAADLAYTPLYVRYNSGLHISDNGEALDALLEEIVTRYPVPIAEIVLLGHSMGGLVIRSACHAGSMRGEARRWLPLARRAIYVGSPHQGAPLERFGNVVAWALGSIGNPYTRLVADIVNLRSHGIKDLRYGSLRREDWEGADLDALLQDRRHPVPLLPHIQHHLVVGTLTGDPHLALLFGDGLVPVKSARGSTIFPQEHVRVLPHFNHLRLAYHPAAYAAVRAFCEEEPRCNAGAV